MQKASKSRRQYKFQGSQGAQKGRPTRDDVKPKNTESVYHCFVKQKNVKRRIPTAFHLLQKPTDRLRRNIDMHNIRAFITNIEPFHSVLPLTLSFPSGVHFLIYECKPSLRYRKDGGGGGGGSQHVINGVVVISGGGGGKINYLRVIVVISLHYPKS